MSQPRDYRLQSDEKSKLVNHNADGYLTEDYSSCDDRPRGKVGRAGRRLSVDSVEELGEKITVDVGYLKGMETMIRDLQRRVDICEQGPESASSSSLSSQQGSINSTVGSVRPFVRDKRHPRRRADVGYPADEPIVPTPPADPHYPSPPPPPFAGLPVNTRCGPITIDGLPRLEIVRLKQSVSSYGDPEWHADYESPVSAAAPNDFSHQSILTVIREFDRNKRFWRQRVKIVSPSVIGFLKNLPCYDLENNWKDEPKDGELRLTEPLMVLFHNRKNLQNQAATETRLVQDQVHFILDFMRNEHRGFSHKLDDIESERPSGFITYPELFLLYAPGTVVYSLESGEYEAFVIDSLRGMQNRQGGGQGRLDLTCWSINYDGEIYGRVWSIHTIPPFHGIKQISSLDLVPERFLLERDNVKSNLIDRGHNFWSLQGQNFLEYTGEVWSQHISDETVRVMIDQLTYQRRNDWPISIDKKRGPQNARSKNWQDDRFGHRDRSPVMRCYETEYVPERSDDSQVRADSYRRYHTDRPARESASDFDKYNVLSPNSTPDELTLLLCPQQVHGYHLRDKVWKELNVSQLQPVAFRKNAWDRLVLDDEYKDIVQAMVSSYVDKTGRLDDLVAGKGAGLVALLHGPPGSGKTLTAECVADSFEKPLYQVTCGDIGTYPEDVEERLEEIFDYAVTWGAIVLLDEADIFLQDRDYTNLRRNALVSIFLRTLEYFNGVLFLTTNRVGAFDQAFQSRIHVTLGLPSLDERRRTSVWAIFLQDLARKGAITHTVHDTLMEKVSKKWSKEKLNGRQIRNTVRTALVVAEKKGAMVGEKEFETVLKIGREFENYMGMLGKGEVNAGLEGFQEV